VRLKLHPHHQSSFGTRPHSVQREQKHILQPDLTLITSTAMIAEMVRMSCTQPGGVIKTHAQVSLGCRMHH